MEKAPEKEAGGLVKEEAEENSGHVDP